MEGYVLCTGSKVQLLQLYHVFSRIGIVLVLCIYFFMWRMVLSLLRFLHLADMLLSSIYHCTNHALCAGPEPALAFLLFHSLVFSIANVIILCWKLLFVS